jgi:FkbM family methyltransferase
MTRVNGRWDIDLPPHRAAREQWTSPLGWERERLNSMALNLCPGDLIVDVGAEEGDMSGLYSLWGCDVYLVEPNPKVWPNIRWVWEHNDLALPVGWYVGFVGGNSGEGLLAEESMPQDGWPTCAYGDVIGDHGFRHYAEERDTTPSRTLDWVSLQCERIDGRLPSAVTIDVEGAEYEVLYQGQNFLREARPLVWVSVHPQFSRHHFGYGPEKLNRLMRSLDYDGHVLANDHEIHVLWEPR